MKKINIAFFLNFLVVLLCIGFNTFEIKAQTYTVGSPNSATGTIVNDDFSSVNSIVRADSNPTNATTVNFTVTFSHAVTGVDATDFILTTTPTANGTIGTPTTSDNIVYNVPVGSITGNGTIRLDLTDNNTIVNNGQPLGGTAANDGDFTTGEVYTVSEATPEINLSANGNSIIDGDGLGDASPTNGTDFANICVEGSSATITYTITNSGDADLDFTGSPLVGITGDVGDFSVTTQPATDPVPHTTGNTTTFVITFDPTTSGQRTATVSIANNDSDENPFDFVIKGTGVSPTVTFTAPSDRCISAAAELFSLAGSPVVGSTGVYSGAGVTNIGDGLSYVFTPATAGVGTHTLTYTFTDGNGCTNTASDDVEVFSVPEVTSIVRADSNPTDAASVDFTVTFSESITGMGTGDFVIDATGITGASVTGISGSGAAYTVTVNTGSGSGTLSIDFDADASGGVTNGNCVSTADFTNGEEYDICGCSPVCSPLPTAAGTYTAIKSETDAAGYTHFCDGSGNLLLSVKIPTGGSIQNGAVSLKINNPLVTFQNQYCGGTSSGSCIVTHPDGSPLLYRQWHIDDSMTSNVFGLTNIIYYFTGAEFTALQNSATANGATTLGSPTDMLLYKINDFAGTLGFFPDPSTTPWNFNMPIAFSTTIPSANRYIQAAYSGLTSDGMGFEFQIFSLKGGGGAAGRHDAGY